MAKKLTKKQIEMLEQLRADKEINGRGYLRMFLIRNTYEPKYKVGDFVKITDTSSRIWGNTVIDVNARIDEINWWITDKGNECVQYCCTAYDQFGQDHLVCAEESIHGYYEKRHITGRSSTDQNVFEKKNKVSDSCSI